MFVDVGQKCVNYGPDKIYIYPVWLIQQWYLISFWLKLTANSDLSAKKIASVLQIILLIGTTYIKMTYQFLQYGKQILADNFNTILKDEYFFRESYTLSSSSTVSNFCVRYSEEPILGSPKTYNDTRNFSNKSVLSINKTQQ